jgi:hypothetical protein
LSIFERIKKILRESILIEYIDEAYIQGICGELIKDTRRLVGSDLF